jgi:phenylpyruvate tautomerase PptA (4-oxalocrotonate tautomerase family)
MPLVEVKVFEDELTPEQTKQLIQKITDAVTTVTSEKLRDVTWVIVNPVMYWFSGNVTRGCWALCTSRSLRTSLMGANAG